MLDFEIQSAASGPVDVTLNGDLTLGPHLRRFAAQVAECMAARRPPAVLLDLTALGNVDSAGLGELVILYTTGQQHGCRLALVNPPARVRQLLQTTRLSGLLPCYAGREAALRD